MKSIYDIPCPPHKYEVETYNKLSDRDLIFSQMPISERLFINGLVRFLKPSNILELGVAEGGGSIVLLNAISDMPESRLTSIDISEVCYWNSTGSIGHAALKKYPNIDNWTLITGKEPAEVMDSLGTDKKFDFVVLDTAHFHPGESLNFLTFFPYLNDNAVVIIQDIGLYAINLDPLRSTYCSSLHSFPNIQLAGKLLFDTVVGEKIKLSVSDYCYECGSNMVYSNIGAIQTNGDTRKYIGDIFSMLEFPWGILPKKFKSISDYISKHYDTVLYKKLIDAHHKNSILMFSCGTTYNMSFDKTKYKKIIFYGCGTYLRSIWKRRFLTPDEIWDENAAQINSNIDKYGFLEGVPVNTPKLELEDKTNIAVIITLAGDTNRDVIDKVNLKLQANGFSNVLHVRDCF